MKKPLDIEYIKNCFKDFYTQIIENNFLHKDDKSLHIHSNKSTLDKLGESNKGNLLFSNREIIETDVMNSALSTHNTSNTSHADLRDLIKNLSTKLNALADSDDETLDQLSEIVSYIKNNKDLIDGITTSKVSITDIIDNIDSLQSNTVSGKIVDALIIKEVLESLNTNISNITPETINAANEDHTHGYMKTITLSTTEPTTVAENEIVMVYEDISTPPPIIQTKKLIDISASNPTKTEYIQNEIFDSSGIIVTAHYDSGEIQDVTSSAIITPDSGSILEVLGNNVITISYTENDVTKIATVTVTVSEQKSSLKIVTWADGTWTEISDMLNAHYSGEIDITNYWNIGDIKTVDLTTIDTNDYYNSAQTIELTIIGFNHDIFENNAGTAAVTIQMKDCLNEVMAMNNAEKTNAGGWEYCPCRTFCNSIFKTALPSELQNLIKTVLKNTSQGNQNTSIIRSHDDCFLVSEREVFGEGEYSAENEGTQYEYYKIENNRLKDCSSNSPFTWWLRSPRINNSEGFAYVASKTSGSGSSATNMKGISVAMCI